MESVESHAVSEIRSKFDTLASTPDLYLEQQEEKLQGFKQIVKNVYDLTVSSNIVTDLKAKSLPKLLIDGFDEEQIWQQTEIQNKAAEAHFSKIQSNINSADVSFAINLTNTNRKTPATELCAFSDDDSNVQEEYDFDGDSDSSTDVVKVAKKKKSSQKAEEYNFYDDSNSSTEMVESTITKKSANKEEECTSDDYSDSSAEIAEPTITEKNSNKEEEYAFEDDSDSSTNMVEAIRVEKDSLKDEEYTDDDSVSSKNQVTATIKDKTARKRSKPSYKSEVDDQFFKLSKLGEFLNIEDMKAEKEVAVESDDEDYIDLFQDIPSDDMEACDEESDEEDEKAEKSAKDMMYEDFFDAPESGDESVGSAKDHNGIMNGDTEGDDDLKSDYDEEKQGLDDFNVETKNMEHENNLEEEDAQIPVVRSTLKTAFEIEQEKIRKKIQECEKSMLEPLPWHLTGEVDASSRPIDSLVHHETDFDSNAKQELIVDKELTEKVENIIKMAIINKAFCDVERKVKPTEEVIAFKKEVALDQTKSKKSLAAVYEEDYLKKQSKQEEEENPKHKEIKKLMDSLFPELHALFSHIPKPAIPEIKIVSNLPAITVEEVAPTSISDVNLLAPEEVKEKSGLVKGTSERTDTDKKRERRKKKIHQRLKEQKKQEKLESRKANPSAKMSKLEKLETLKKLKQNKNTKIANVDEAGKIKSSKDFFSRLQDTVDTKIKTKTQVLYKKKKS